MTAFERLEARQRLRIIHIDLYIHDDRFFSVVASVRRRGLKMVYSADKSSFIKRSIFPTLHAQEFRAPKFGLLARKPSQLLHFILHQYLTLFAER